MTRFFPGLRDPLVCAGLLLAVGLYTAALFLPAFDWTFVGSSREVMSGREALFTLPKMLAEHLQVHWERGRSDSFSEGTGLYWGWLARAWLPNVLLWLGLFCLAAGRRHAPWLVGAFALYEGTLLVICAPGLTLKLMTGYYVWLASMAVLTAAGAYRAVWPHDRLGFATQS